MGFKNLGLAYLSTKGTQSVLKILNPLVKNDSIADIVRHITEKYVCKAGSAIIAAYTIDRGISYAEGLLVPKKSLRGFAPLMFTIFGTAAALHYGGPHTDLAGAVGVAEAAREAAETGKEAAKACIYYGSTYKDTLLYHLQNSKQAFVDLANLNPEYKEGYLINSLVGVFSGARWIKNVAISLRNHAEEKVLEEERDRQEHILSLEHAINRDVRRKRVI